MSPMQTCVRCLVFSLALAPFSLPASAQDAGAGSLTAQGANWTEVRSNTKNQPSGSNAASASIEELPDSPGTEWSKLQSSNMPQDGVPQSSPSPAPNPPEQKSQRPVGTAAAEAPNVNGVTAAEPAGVAIAPAKQRRVRTIVLRVGAIIGAGAALGTVIALSAGTSSKPPGAH